MHGIMQFYEVSRWVGRDMEFHDELWKRELKIHLDAIRSIDITSDAPERVFDAEKPIFYAAFIVRKLIEDTAVTDRLKSRSVELDAFDSNRDGKEFFIETMLGPLDVSEWFDLKNPTRTRISYFDLSSEIIHSDAFVWIVGSEPPGTFLVCSHRNRLHRLLSIPVSDFDAVIETVLEDRPKRWSIRRDFETGRIRSHAE